MDNLEPTDPQNIADPNVRVLVQKPQKSLAIVLILLFLGVAGVGSAWAYNKYIDSSEIKIKKSFEKTSKANSFAYEGVLNFDVSKSEYKDYLNAGIAGEGEVNVENVEISFNGVQEGFGTESEKNKFSFLIKTLPGDSGMSLGFDTLSRDKRFYARLSGVNNLPFDVGSYKDKWVKIDISAYLDTLGLKTAVLATGTTSGSIETLDDIRNKKVKEMVLRADLLKVNNKSTKKIDGVSFNVYNVTIQKDNLKKLFLDISAFENARITEKQLASFEKGMESIQDATGEIWIGKKDSLIYQLNFDVLGTGGEKSVFRLAFKDFGNKMVVDEPADAILLEELLKEVFGSLGLSASSTSW